MLEETANCCTHCLKDSETLRVRQEQTPTKPESRVLSPRPRSRDERMEGEQAIISSSTAIHFRDEESRFSSAPERYGYKTS